MIKNINLPDYSILYDPKWVIKVGGEIGCAFTSMREVVALCYFASICGGNIVEIGCNEGHTTAPLACNSPGKIVYAIDCSYSCRLMIPEQQHECPSEIGRLVKDLPNVKLLDIDSSKLRYTDFSDVRMIFIDGGHHWEQIHIDSQMALSHLGTTGGYIFWHDYGRDVPWISVTEYLNTIILPHYDLHLVSGTSLAFINLEPTLNRTE